MLLFRRAWMTTARAAVLAVALAAVGSSAIPSAIPSSAAPSSAAAPKSHGRPAAGPVVATDAGPVRGLVTGSIKRFTGIPYAAPPVGNLRWRPPQPVAPHGAVRDATAFGPHCPQPGTFWGKASSSEDCLYLNVYTPAHKARAKLPVMVWIHGGAFLTGESDSYDPTSLVRHSAVVVTLNYRLGAFGFLAHPALSAEAGGASGNYGLMDQQAALRWVHRNIRNFGGNPRNVTILGESAGGLSVLAQIASRSAAGLFARAIVQSGAYALRQPSQASANTTGMAYAAAVGCPDQTATCLRAVPAVQLLAKQNSGVGDYQPNIDGRVLTQSISTALSKGQFNRVPLLNGSNRDEWRLFVAFRDLAGTPVTAATYQSAISATLGVDAATAAAILAQYPVSHYPSPDVALGAVGTDALFACSARTVDQLASRYVPTYAYEFADEQAPQVFLPPVSFPYGAYHAAELQYLFGLPEAPLPHPLSSAQQQLSGTMQRYWTDFASLGRPSRTGTKPPWPAFTKTAERYQQLVAPEPRPATNFAAEHHCAFWASR